MQQSVVISRYVFSAICALIVILAIALFITLTKEPDEKHPKSVVEASIAWIQDGGVVPLGSSELQGYFSKEGVYSVLLFKEDGRFRWVDGQGNEIRICGQTIDGTIRGCGIEGKKVELTTFTEFTLIGIKGSVCTLGGSLGYTGWVHSGHSRACPH